MQFIFFYDHKVQYYETDGMRIVHHANYLHWMEEARIAYMEHMHYGYDCMERDGVSIPVIGVSVQYRSMMRFGQTCRIYVAITKLTPVRMTVAYEFRDAMTNKLCGTATSDHCFIGENGRPLSLKKKLPEQYERYRAAAEQAQDE